jgi:hypothetical protein
MGAGDASTGRADIQGLAKLDKFNAQSVYATKEYRNLNADAWILALMSK